MQVRQLAQTILFGTTIEDKLVLLKGAEDTERGVMITTPEAPGRPVGLELNRKHAVATVGFPGLHELDRDDRRGHVFHYFANHELLALELMALALLKFPDAPPAFRRGVVGTMIDEQKHLGLYFARMAACGVEFGEIPVNAFFWRCSAGMTEPMDYVTQLGLTFEQANLDYCMHYANAFETIGDADTVAVLSEVCQDEVQHVEHSLDWFNRWRPAGEPEFAAYKRLLKPPLTPNRAKGFTFNLEGRRRAGLSAEFIDELLVFNRSKGRPPDIFANPGRADLVTVPIFLATGDDIVLVDRRPRTPFLRSLQRAGFTVPELLETPPRGGAVPREAIQHKQIGRLRPWAWNQDSRTLLGTLAPRDEAEVPAPRLDPDELSRALAGQTGAAWLCRAPETGAIRARLSLALAVEASGHPVFHGACRTMTDDHGRFAASVLGRPTLGMSPELVRFVHDDGNDRYRLRDLFAAVTELVAREAHGLGYSGPIGVDAELLEVATGVFKLRPIAAVHHQLTMSRVSLALAAHLQSGHAGYWLVLEGDRLGNLADFAARIDAEFPVATVRANGVERIAGGALFTTDPQVAESTLTVLIAGETLEACGPILDALGVAQSALG